jgi:hypothetical protein
LAFFGIARTPNSNGCHTHKTFVLRGLGEQTFFRGLKRKHLDHRKKSSSRHRP